MTSKILRLWIFLSFKMYSIFVALLFLKFATCHLPSTIGSIELDETFIKTYMDAFQENFAINYSFNEVPSTLNLICGETDESEQKRDIDVHVRIVKELLRRHTTKKCVRNIVSEKNFEDCYDFNDNEKLIIFNSVSEDTRKYLSQFLPECIRAKIILRKDANSYNIPLYMDLLSAKYTDNYSLLAAFGPNENSYFFLKMKKPSVWKLESFVQVIVVGYIDENTFKLVDTKEKFPPKENAEYKPRDRIRKLLKSVKSNCKANSLEKEWVRSRRKMLSENSERESWHVSSVAPFMTREQGVIYRYSDEVDAKLNANQLLELMFLKTFSEYERQNNKITINVSNEICESTDATIRNVKIRKHVKNLRYIVNSIVERDYENHFELFYFRNENLLNSVPRNNRKYGYEGPSCHHVRLVTSSTYNNIRTAFLVKALFVKIGENHLHNILLIILPGKGNAYFILKSEVEQNYFHFDYDLGDKVKVVGFVNPDEYEESNIKEFSPKIRNEKRGKNSKMLDDNDGMRENSDENHEESDGKLLNGNRSNEKLSKKAEKINGDRYVLLIKEKNIERIRERNKYLTSEMRNDRSGNDTLVSNSNNLRQNIGLFHKILIKPVYRPIGSTKNMKSSSPREARANTVKHLYKN